jgi:tetratricopeptide (TPR) repeat protein
MDRRSGPRLRTRRGAGWLALTLGLVALTVPSARPRDPVAASPLGQPVPSTPQAAALRQAQDWLRLRLPERALALLEPLHRDAPEDVAVAQLLAEAYTAAGRHAEAAALFRSQAERRGTEDPSVWVQLARAHQRAGEGRLAIEALLECTRLRPEWAPHLLDAFQLLATDSLVGPEARAALEIAAGGSGSPPEWAEALAQAQALTGEGEKALALAMRLERQRSTDGRRLTQLAHALLRGGQADAAIAALDSLRSLPLRDRAGEEALVEKGGMLETLGRDREAVEAYAEAERRFPDGAVTLRATLRRARLLLEELGDPAGARAAFARVDQRTRGRPQKELRGLRDEALLGAAECDLRSGELGRADSAFAAIAETAASGAAREQAAYQRADLLFFQARFADAEEAYYQLTDRYPAGQWANDALQRALLLGESGATPQALEPLAHALYQLRVGRRDEALALCEQGLARSDSGSAGAELWRLKVTLLADQGRWAEADSALARLVAAHPRSRAVPATLLVLAERSASDPSRRAAGRGYYERVVLEHPGSFAARRARAWLEARRAAGETS